jgi:hypothetical protein
MPIGSSSSVRTGASVVALGNAEGQGSITAAACHITGLNQVITVSDVGGPVLAGTLHGMIQTNAGGPARRYGAEHTLRIAGPSRRSSTNAATMASVAATEGAPLPELKGRPGQFGPEDRQDRRVPAHPGGEVETAHQPALPEGLQRASAARCSKRMKPGSAPVMRGAVIFS